MTIQSISSIARQVLAIAGIVMGVVTASVTQLHLPTAVSSILVVAGSVILAIEHYVGDPSTGSTPPATHTTPSSVIGTP
jgi:hypothetical protein